MRAFGIIFSKEILSFLRSFGLIIVVLYSFTLDIYIAGNGIDVKPRNVIVGYVDYSNSVMAQKLLSNLHKPEFQKVVRFYSQKSLSDAIFNKEIIVGIIFNKNFEKDFLKNRKIKIDILLDSTTASQSFITLTYLQNIIFDFVNPKMPLDLKIHKLFNQNSDSKIFMSFVEMLSVITMLGIILTAVVFVKEKEDGTWDIMLLTPVNSKIIIFAKSLSQVAIVMGGVILSIGFILFSCFNVPLNGSFWAFFLLTLLYSLTLAGIGLFIAAVSESVTQVAQLSIVVMMPLIFLSGAWTPIYSMHPLLQKLSVISPLRYYIEGSESIFFRGTSWFDLIPYFAGVSALGVLTFWYGYKKIGRLF